MDDDDDDLTEDEEYSDDDEIVRGRSDRGGGGRGDGDFVDGPFGGDEEHDFRIDDEGDDGEFVDRNGGGGGGNGQDQVDGESPYILRVFAREMGGGLSRPRLRFRRKSLEAVAWT